MIKIYKLLFIIVFGSILTSCISNRSLSNSKTTVLPLGETVNLYDGSLVYSLPLTVLHFKVTMKHTIERPGPYFRYAGELLGLKDVITESNESWEIRNIDITTTEELDPSQFYVIQSNSLQQFNALSLRKEGLILDINPETFNKINYNNGSLSENQENIVYNDMGAYEYYEITRDTSYRVVELDTAFIKIPYLVEKKRALTIDQLAENAARTLLELRDGKQMILTGEANVYPQDRAAIEEMNKLENDYFSLFAGKSITEFKTSYFSIVPEKKNGTSEIVLFRFSEFTGIVNSTAAGGSPVTIELIPSQKTRELNYISNDQVSSGEKLYDKLYYRVPDVVNIRSEFNKETISESRKLIYQFGSVIQLPSNYIIGK